MSDPATLVPRLDAHGANLPALGLGTSKLRDAECRRAVTTALELGYRAIDTAVMYGNEVEVGEGLRASGLPRAELFVTTKVLPTDIDAGALQSSAQASLERLKLDQIDLLLIHWPNRAIPLARSIEALCDARRRGLTRAIGVANFPLPCSTKPCAWPPPMGRHWPPTSANTIRASRRRHCWRPAVVTGSCWSPTARSGKAA